MFLRNKKERQWLREQVDYYKRQMNAAYEINNHTDAKYYDLLREYEELQALTIELRNTLSRAAARINNLEKESVYVRSRDN